MSESENKMTIAEIKKLVDESMELSKKSGDNTIFTDYTGMKKNIPQLCEAVTTLVEEVQRLREVIDEAGATINDVTAKELENWSRKELTKSKKRLGEI